MQRTCVEQVITLLEIVCARCGLRASRAADGGNFKRMTSIGFRAEEKSIFGPGQRIEIDLCEPCLRNAQRRLLGVRTPTGGEFVAGLAAELAGLDPQRHGWAFVPLTQFARRIWRSRNAASHAWREEALRFPTYAWFTRQSISGRRSIRMSDHPGLDPPPRADYLQASNRNNGELT